MKWNQNFDTIETINNEVWAMIEIQYNLEKSHYHSSKHVPKPVLAC